MYILPALPTKLTMTTKVFEAIIHEEIINFFCRYIIREFIITKPINQQNTTRNKLKFQDQYIFKVQYIMFVKVITLFESNIIQNLC